VLAAHVATGDLDVAGVAGSIDAHVTTGDIHLRDVAADASAIGTTGDIEIDLVPAWSGRRLVARTTTGDVDIHASSSLRARVDAHSNVGDVRNGLRATSVTAPVIEARSNVGDVTIATHG
jgi:DUF4097 and DUF4098 domain-containing protein YvlB